MLHAAHLSKTYRRPSGGDLRVLTDVSLDVAAGEHVAILGASGSGKSTLLQLLGGLDTPDKPARGSDAPAPELTLGGEPFLSAREAQRTAIRASRIGFVFQAFQLLPDLSVLDNVYLPALALPRASRPARERAVALLRAAGLGERLDHRPAELSGGEQQRAAVARALINSPALLLADEPTGNLDAANGAQILDLLWGLSATVGGTAPALVVVTHSDAVAARCDRTLHLVNGRF